MTATYDELAIVVPIRLGEPRRNQIRDWVSRRYSELTPGAQIVLGASQADVFSRSEAINNALGHVRSELEGITTILVADADHVIHEDWLADSYTATRSGKVWCVPQVHVFLEEEMSNAWMGRSPDWPADHFPGVLPPDVDWWGYTGVSGLVMCSLEAMIDVRGFDERFDGWGLQDAGFAVALTALGYERVKDRWCAHLWHPKNEAEPAGVGQQYGNWPLFRRYEGADEHDVRKLIAQDGHDRGWWR